MSPVVEAFIKFKRADFLTEEMKENADLDAPLSIGFGQTNSQPSTVRVMLEWLDVPSGGKVLDIGSGSGWTTALLSKLVGPKGKVYAVEKIPELVSFGRENCERAGVKNAKFFQAGKILGLPQNAPYDRILVSASSPKLHTELIEQLKPRGKLVVPVGNDILEIEKNEVGRINTFVHSGFVFVPLVVET